MRHVNSSRDCATTLWCSVTQLLCCAWDLNSLLFTEGKGGKEESSCFGFGLSRSCGEVAADKALHEQQSSPFLKN